MLHADLWAKAIPRFGLRRLAVVGIAACTSAIAALSLTGGDYPAWLALQAVYALGAAIAPPRQWAI